jgi:hypothetical protein
MSSMAGYESLTGGEMVLLIEALDVYIGSPEDAVHALSEEKRERLLPYDLLRRRLKEAIHMSFYSRANNWLEDELSRERIALSDKLHSRLAELLSDPRANRRNVREGFAAAMQELREVRQSKPRPLS